MQTQQRLIPTNNIQQIVKDKLGFCVVYLYLNARNEPCATGFTGRKIKANFRLQYKSESERTAWVSRWMNEKIKVHTDWLNYKAEQKLNRTVKAEAYAKDIRIGDLFCSQFSYNMTFNTFYQVVSLPKGKTLEVVKCNMKWVDGDIGFTGNVSAVPLTASELLEAKPIKARVVGDLTINISGADNYASFTTPDQKHYENHMD